MVHLFERLHFWMRNSSFRLGAPTKINLWSRLNFCYSQPGKQLDSCAILWGRLNGISDGAGAPQFNVLCSLMQYPQSPTHEKCNYSADPKLLSPGADPGILRGGGGGGGPAEFSSKRGV